MRIGLVGYGVGGRYFHAPFLEAASGVELVGVVTTNPQRRAEVEADLPGVAVFDSIADLAAAGAEAVTISTPPHTRHDLVLESIGAGLATIADKPFAPSAQGGRELAAAAEAAGIVLTVFHNRRWDSDIRTLASALPSLGELQRVESRFDQNYPGLLEVGPHGGLLRDLGSHVVDQMLWLLGPVDSVYARIGHTQFPEGVTDSSFDITLTHASGVISRVSSTKLNRIDDRELRAYGSLGTFVSHSIDVQAQDLFAGKRPAQNLSTWGYEPEQCWGQLHTADGVVTVPAQRGGYQDYYEAFAAALRGEGELPVTLEEGIHTLEVLDAARESAQSNAVVQLSRGQ